MKILVTGGQGKVGRFVVQELVNSAHEVTVFDRVPGPERGAIRYLVGDIQDLGQVMEAMHGAEAVIHLAAIHNPNIATATVTYQTNVVGTFNVHHAAHRARPTLCGHASRHGRFQRRTISHPTSASRIER